MLYFYTCLHNQKIKDLLQQKYISFVFFHGYLPSAGQSLFRDTKTPIRLFNGNSLMHNIVLLVV